MEAIEQKLLDAAVKARNAAYAPYSNYWVGAALLGKSGKIYTGCNVENVSFGATICAERVAAVKAISEGETNFTALAVVADSPVPATPCGICRQFLAEFAPDLKMICANLQGKVNLTDLTKYLPDAFGPKHLNEFAGEMDGNN